MEQQSAQTIVKVFATLTWIGAALMMIMGVALLTWGTIGSAKLTLEGASNAGFFGLMSGIMGFAMLFVGIAYIFVGRGLWQNKEWARITTLIFAVLSIFTFPLGTIIGAIEIWLFGFQKDVKALFKK